MESLFIRVADLRCFHVNFAKFLRTPCLFKFNWTIPELQSDDVIIFSNRIGNAYTVKMLSLIRSSRPEVLRPATLSRKRHWRRCFPVNFAKFLRALFLAEHLRWLLLFDADRVFCFQGGGIPVSKIQKALTMTFKVKNL